MKSNECKLSIIVPVYNMEKYIERCLNSLINQSLVDFEVIIVNDGSTDKSKEIIMKYIEKYPYKFKYYEKENGGLSSSRNYGFKFASGKYIAFLDSDDYVEKNMYEEMINLALKEDLDLVECDYIWEYPDGKKRYDKRRKYTCIEDMIKRPRVVAWNRLIKRKIIEKNNIRFPNGKIYEDLEFYFKLLPHLNRISYIPKYFVHYTQREDSISNNQNKKVSDIFDILNNIDEYYKENGIYDKYKKHLKYMRIRILLGSSMKRILKIGDKSLRWKLIKKTLRNL